MEADSDQRDNWERCNEASVGRTLARQPNGRSGKNPAAIFLSLGSWGGLMGETCEESEPVVSLWCDSWEGTVTKLAGGLLFFLPFPLPWGGHYITLHYSTLLWGGLSLLYSTLLYLGAVFSLLYITGCNKTNPTYTFFLTINTFSSPYRSFCIPYCLPLLSHDMSSCQHRSYSCDTNSITNTSNSHSMSHSMLLFSHHDQLSTSPFITFPLHDQLLTSHDILSTSIPTPRPTLHFSIHYIPTP